MDVLADYADMEVEAPDWFVIHPGAADACIGASVNRFWLALAMTLMHDII
jgi:hypothetical protein